MSEFLSIINIMKRILIQSMVFIVTLLDQGKSFTG